MEQDRLVPPPEAAQILGFEPVEQGVRYLARKRYEGGGPRFIAFSRRKVRYRLSDLLEWIDSHEKSRSRDRSEAEAYGEGR